MFIIVVPKAPPPTYKSACSKPLTLQFVSLTDLAVFYRCQATIIRSQTFCVVGVLRNAFCRPLLGISSSTINIIGLQCVPCQSGGFRLVFITNLISNGRFHLKFKTVSAGNSSNGRQKLTMMPCISALFLHFLRVLESFVFCGGMFSHFTSFS